MAFFRNLRARLMKSSQAIEAKIDAVVQDDSSDAIYDEKVVAHNADKKEKSSSGLLSRLTGKNDTRKRRLDDAMVQDLEDALISSDVGVDTTLKIVASIAQTHFNKMLSVDEVKNLIAAEIKMIMEAVARPLPLYNACPQVILIVGVNGVGKTTTVGKLAAQFREAGKSVLIAAGDTFRAAAVRQLEIWAERAQCGIIKASNSQDPASLAFDALMRAEAEKYDIVLIDTAGRLHNRQDLMDELAKIIRVLKKKHPEAPHNSVLVLDATTGQNALSQVKIFQQIADISGLIMTKLDGSAKGGVLVGLADQFGLPIHAIGVGEQIDDLGAFEPDEFADALIGNLS